MRPTIVLQNQVLVRRDGDAFQLVVPQSLRHQLFTHTHAGPLAAHLGSQLMLAQLRRFYYWPGMRKDIGAWCRQCEGCAISRGPPSRPHGHLREVSAGAPMDLVAIDILSGLPATANGYKYILVAIDYFTKWLDAIPLCDAEAHTCMRALYSALQCVDFRKWFQPRDHKNPKPTREGIALNLDQWVRMIKIVEGINNDHPVLAAAIPCYLQEDHQNQMGALECPECHPFTNLLPM